MQITSGKQLQSPRDVSLVCGEFGLPIRFRGMVNMSSTLVRKLIACSVVFLFAIAARAAASSARVNRADLIQQDELAVKRLQESYDDRTGLWGKQGWWHDANSLTAIIDFSRTTGSNTYLPEIERTFSANIGKRFLINKFYDDEGWWALAWMDAYDLTGDVRYLNAAAGIFDDLTTGWDDTCGGGLWWTRDRTYKNAIPNELFLKVSAGLANRTKDPQAQRKYIEWADREWNWFRESGMIDQDHLINDGLDAQCQNNHRKKWSYNQGVVLGGLAELSRVPGHSSTLRQAETIANAAIQKLSDSDGILHEPCEPKCSGDGTQFKGIFIRNLAELNERARRRRYSNFMASNAKSLIDKAEKPDHSFGLIWSGPPGTSDSITQTSAIDALSAAVEALGK
jgi:predicted alpha-1,6-mannanase (GH76 family)